MLSVYPSVGRDWNHKLAALRRQRPFSGSSTGPLGPLWKHPLAENAEVYLRLHLANAQQVINRQ